MSLLSTGSDTSNDCSDENNPCATWSYATSLIDGSESLVSLNIGGGEFSVYSGLDVSVGGWWSSSNYTISGKNEDGKSVLKTLSSSVTLFDFSASSSNYIYADLSISDLTYIPLYAQYTRLGYFYYNDNVKFSNVIVDGSFASWYSYRYYIYNLMYIYQVNSLIIENMNILDVNTVDGYSDYLFAIYYTDYVSFSRIVCNVTGGGIDSEYNSYFAIFDENDYSEMHFNDIKISNSRISEGFYITDNDYSHFYFDSIEFDNVYGGRFFYIYSNWAQTINMSNININANNGTISSSILYCGYNYNGELTISNSEFKNIKLGTSAVAFYLYYAYSYARETIRFENVLFSNIEASSGSYGLIFINSYFDVVIDNCTFSNNTNFPAIIHCDTSSYCNVVIKNSVFDKNDGLCGDSEILMNGIYLGTSAYGTLEIENTLFIGIPWIDLDATSTISIDNATQSMMVDVGANYTNNDNKCASKMRISVSEDGYVIFFVWHLLCSLELLVCCFV